MWTIVMAFRNDWRVRMSLRHDEWPGCIAGKDPAYLGFKSNSSSFFRCDAARTHSFVFSACTDPLSASQSRNGRCRAHRHTWRACSKRTATRAPGLRARSSSCLLCSANVKPALGGHTVSGDARIHAAASPWPGTCVADDVEPLFVVDLAHGERA